MQPNPAWKFETTNPTSKSVTHLEQRQALNTAIAEWSHAVITGDAFAQLVSAADAGARELDLALALDWDQAALDAAARVHAETLDGLDRLRLLEVKDMVRRRAIDRRTRYGDDITAEQHPVVVDAPASSLLTLAAAATRPSRTGRSRRA